MLAAANGEDELGNYILKPPILWEQEYEKNGLFKSLVIDPDKPEETEAESKTDPSRTTQAPQPASNRTNTQ